MLVSQPRPHLEDICISFFIAISQFTTQATFIMKQLVGSLSGENLNTPSPVRAHLGSTFLSSSSPFRRLHVTSERQKVLFCIIPALILEGSWVTYIKSQAGGGGLIASINLIQPHSEELVRWPAPARWQSSYPLVPNSESA